MWYDPDKKALVFPISTPDEAPEARSSAKVFDAVNNGSICQRPDNEAGSFQANVEFSLADGRS